MTNLVTSQTFTTSQVALNYGLSSYQTITDHFTRHRDELIENQHYFLELNKFGNKTIKWTLEGIYMLGFFIKSHKAKEYRKQVAEMLKEQSEAKFNSYTNQISSLQAIQISEAKHHANQINGYKSTLAKQKSKLEVLKAQLVIANDKAKEISSKER